MKGEVARCPGFEWLPALLYSYCLRVAVCQIDLKGNHGA